VEIYQSSQQLLKPWKEDGRTERSKVLRIFPYGINRHRLDKSFMNSEAPAAPFPSQRKRRHFDCARAS